MLQIGDRVARPVQFDKGFTKVMVGRVVYIHPERRFYDVVFESDKGATLRESYNFEYSEMLPKGKNIKGRPKSYER